MSQLEVSFGVQGRHVKYGPGQELDPSWTLRDVKGGTVKVREKKGKQAIEPCRDVYQWFLFQLGTTSKEKQSVP